MNDETKQTRAGGESKPAPDLREALAELYQSAEYVFRNHERQITGTAKLWNDLERARAALASQRDSRPSSVHQVESDSEAVQRPALGNRE